MRFIVIATLLAAAYAEEVPSSGADDVKDKQATQAVEDIKTFDATVDKEAKTAAKYDEMTAD